MKKLVYLLVVGITLFSCRKDEVNLIDGPSLTDVFGSFQVKTDLEPKEPSVDFTSEQSTFFTCEFTTVAEWQLTIVGRESGATKIITGSSKVLNAETASWNGSTTLFPMFEAEMCDVMLTFTNQPDTLNTEIEVLSPKENPGFLIADFESGWNNGWSTFIQSGADMDFNIKTNETAPQEGAYYNMQGTVNWDWLIGLVDFNATAYGLPVLPLTDNGDNLFFNALVYGEPGLSNTLMLFRFDEDENGDGVFSESSEDQYLFEFPVDWVGWRLVSIRYSELPGTGNGNDTHNPDKINKVSVLHLANPSSGFAKSGLDYIIFTENEALEP